MELVILMVLIWHPSTRCRTTNKESVRKLTRLLW